MRSRFAVFAVVVAAFTGASAQSAPLPSGCVVRVAPGIAEEETCSYIANGPGIVERVWGDGSFWVVVQRWRCHYRLGCWWESSYASFGCGFGPLGLVVGAAPIDLLPSERGDHVTVGVASDCGSPERRGPPFPALMVLSAHDQPEH